MGFFDFLTPRIPEVAPVALEPTTDEMLRREAEEALRMQSVWNRLEQVGHDLAQVAREERLRKRTT